MSSSKRQWGIRGAIVVVCAVVLNFWPLFHIVPLDQAEQQASATKSKNFEPTAFVEKFWTEQLVPAEDQAINASKLIAEIRQDRAEARLAHGRSVGLSNTYYYFVSGTGRVVNVEKNSAGLAIDEEVTKVQVSLETGNIFGNAVRDGTGLLDMNDFANSQEFNSIASEINRHIETYVLPQLRAAATVGATIRFVGCAQITDEDTDLNPLRVVPFIAEVP